ncbi:MAG: nucleotidyl transferase AbiEii/AbiGii toxin family protein [Minisyncoccales bacterium]
MFALHYDLLDKERRQVFKKLKLFGKEGVLSGGTALLLQIGHRFSFDFDIFLDREVKRADLLKLRRLFKIIEVKRNISEQLDVITSDNISITLVRYPYKPLFKTVPTISLPLFSVKDIALDKAFTIGRRALWRDYVDLFFLLKKKYITIVEVIKLAEKKFDIEFNDRLFLEQLSYFKDLEIVKVTFLKEKYSPEEIKDFLKKQAEEYKKLKI